MDGRLGISSSLSHFLTEITRRLEMREQPQATLISGQTSAITFAFDVQVGDWELGSCRDKGPLLLSSGAVQNLRIEQGALPLNSSLVQL